MKLRTLILKKRYYIDNEVVEKFDLLFDNYRYSIIKNMLEISELKHSSLKKILKKKKFRSRIFKRIFLRGLSERIKNELLIISPELLQLHIKAKSWKFIRNKFKNKRRIKNVKKLVLRYFPTYRESFILRDQLKKTYFWLVNTTKRQVLNTMKFNKLKLKNDLINNYFFVKNTYLKKKALILKKRNKYLVYFFQNIKTIYWKVFNLFLLKIWKSSFFLSLNYNKYVLKFVFFKYMYFFSSFFKRTILSNALKDIFNISLSEFLIENKGKLRLRKRIRRRLLFYYDLYKKKKYIYKLKVRMVNSNFFITLTDYNDKVIIYRSTGQVSDSRKKKVKLSPYLVTKMMYSVLYNLRRKKIKFLFFFVNSKINRHINNVMKCLKNARHTKILKVFFSKPLAHHIGTRKPKLRRL